MKYLPTSRKAQHRKSAIHGTFRHPAHAQSSLKNLIDREYEAITLRMFRNLDHPRGRDS